MSYRPTLTILTSLNRDVPRGTWPCTRAYEIRGSKPVGGISAEACGAVLELRQTAGRKRHTNSFTRDVAS